MEKNERKRRYAFTYAKKPKGYNSKKLIEYLNNNYAIEYIIASDEVGETNGLKHIQGYVEFKNPSTWEQIQKRMIVNEQAASYVKAAIGSASQNQTYIKKSGKFHELGTPSVKPDTDDKAYAIMKLIVYKKMHPAIIAFHYPEYSSYLLNHFYQIKNFYETVQMMGETHFPAEQVDDDELPF
jgi:hypothetical protein